MPWSVVLGGGNCAAGKFAVVNKQTGKTMGCHDSRESANRQLAALNANVKEGDMGNRLHESVTLSEAANVATMTASGRMVVRAISAGLGTSGYYSPAVLEAAGRDKLIRRGTPLHVDHPSESERQDRPERSVATIAAVFTDDAHYDPATESLVGPVQVFPPYKERLKEMAPYIGLSISGSATDIVEGEHEGRKVPVIEGLHSIDSVDFVTRAGRGGQVLLAESERPADALTAHIDATFGRALEESGLQIVPVDIPAGQTTTTESLGGTMGKIEIEESEHQRLVDEAGRVKALESERDAAVKERDEAKAEAEKGKAAEGSPRAVMEAQIKETHREVAQLRARERGRIVLAEEFKDAWLTPTVVNRLTEALITELPIVNDQLDEPALRDSAVKARDKAEAEAAELLTEAGLGKPRGLGASTAVGGESEDNTAALTDSFKRLGLSETAATTAAKGR